MKPTEHVREIAGQAGTVISVVTIGILGLIGVLIFGEVFTALPLDTSGAFNSSVGSGALEGEAANIASGFGDAIGLLPIVLLILLASVVIAVVQNMRMQ
jgi:hypothetical protein